MTGTRYMDQFDILVAGEINPDLILTGDIEPTFGQVEKLVDSATLTVGSSSAIFACGAVKLGLKVAFKGICGDDVFGHFMLDSLQQRGVDISAVRIDPKRQTGLSVILSKGNDRAILTHTGTIADLKEEDFDRDLLQSAKHLHVASYFLQTDLQPGLLRLFERAHHLGLTTSLDTNWDPSGLWAGFDQILPHVDVFLPNENEALAISKCDKVEDAAAFLGSKCQTVAMKLGAKGGIARNSAEMVTVPSLKIDVVDTVGAGDTFDAGFLYGYLNNWPLKRSLRLACVSGALSTRSSGGIEGQPTLKEALNFV